MLWSSLRFLGQTSLHIATTCTTRPTTTEMMIQAFYYLHITTTAQSAYPESHNKFSICFCFKVVNVVLSQNCFLFQTKIHTDLFLSVSCVIKWKVMLPLNNNQISLLTVLAVIHRFSLKQPPVYNGCRNFVP